MRFSEKKIYFEKNENFIIFAPKSTQNTRRVVCNYACEKDSEKVSSSIFDIFFIVSKNPKISNLSRDKAPEFQNNVIVNMKTALDGGKKIKTQLFRRRRHRKIQKESYSTSKNCRVKMTPPLRHSRVNMQILHSNFLY